MFANETIYWCCVYYRNVSIATATNRIYKWFEVHTNTNTRSLTGTQRGLNILCDGIFFLGHICYAKIDDCWIFNGDLWGICAEFLAVVHIVCVCVCGLGMHVEMCISSFSPFPAQCIFGNVCMRIWLTAQKLNSILFHQDKCVERRRKKQVSSLPNLVEMMEEPLFERENTWRRQPQIQAKLNVESTYQSQPLPKNQLKIDWCLSC